jgi:hypothetical membrane protein
MFGFDRASREGRMSEHPSEGRAMPRHRGTVGQRLARLGAWALILGVVQFFAFHLIVQSAWPEPYSWVDNNISDLGAVGCGPWEGDGRYVCSPLHAWMNASFVAQGALLAAGLALSRPLRRGLLTRTSLAFVCLAALGFVLAGLAPSDANEGLHVLAAFAIFFRGNVGLIFAENPAQAEEARAVSAFPRTLGTVGLVATALFMGEVWLVLGMGGMERLAVFPLQVWALLTGISILRRGKP